VYEYIAVEPTFEPQKQDHTYRRNFRVEH